MSYITILNNQTVPVSDIPVIKYDSFFELISRLITDNPERHCVNYFGYRTNGFITLICCIADDSSHEIFVTSCLVNPHDKLKSLSVSLLCFEKFENEISENFGIIFLDHPWSKPVRYPENRVDKTNAIADYPFFSIESEELHEVGVGPIHAGIIEPGHFRFICNGEQILHLEIQLGYQHRGIEQLFLEKKKILQLSTLAENIAGDTVAGHAVTFSNVWESLCGFKPTKDIEFSRTLALELERIAIHTGDLSAICTDIAYQLGSAVFGRLRTPIVNYLQEWGGNRLAKGLIRPGRNQFPFSEALKERLITVLDTYVPDFEEMNHQLFDLPSALSRLERTGVVSYEELLSIGAVGMAARSGGLNRDIRASHPTGLYQELNHLPVIKHHGDVYSRVQLKKEEVRQSINYIRTLLNNIPRVPDRDTVLTLPQPDSFCISLVEGWRGEICHCAITGKSGELLIYKIKDPSFHNWLALALSVRNNEISDFPVCNKSFNLSYCGHDL